MELRSLIYQTFLETGKAPTIGELLETVGGNVEPQLARLHNSHVIVLDDRADRRGEIRMALPFSAEPTNFRVKAASGAWWANCAWDSLAVVAAIHQDAEIHSSWSDSGESFRLQVKGGQLEESDGFVHFDVPARHWWDDIVRT